MATAMCGGGPEGPLGRRFPDWGDPCNDYGQMSILQLSASGSLPLPKNPFLIGKCIQQTVGEIEGGRSENQGTCYVLYVRKPDQIKKLLTITKLMDENETPICIQYHPKLNTCRCVISSVDLIEMSEEEISKNLHNQGVIKVQRIKRNENGLQKNTPALILTFGKTTYPQHIKIGVLRVATRKYYPNPMLCYSCYQYGHPKAQCSKPKICYNCSEPAHGETCEKSSFCQNCKCDHRPYNRQCKIYKLETEIIKMKIDYNLTYTQARERVLNGSNSYAKITAQSRIDHARLTALEEALKRKDEQINQLMELNNKKDEQIEKLEHTVQKMKSYIYQELQKQQSVSTSQTKTKPANVEQSNISKSNVNSGKHNLRPRTKRSGLEQSLTRRIDTSSSPERNRSPPLKIANTKEYLSQASSMEPDINNTIDVEISDIEIGDDETEIFKKPSYQ